MTFLKKKCFFALCWQPTAVSSAAASEAEQAADISRNTRQNIIIIFDHLINNRFGGFRSIHHFEIPHQQIPRPVLFKKNIFHN
jgi:hypothetical protein